MLPLPTLWMKILLLFSKCLEVFISGGVWFSGEPQLLERFWYEVSAASSSLASVKDISLSYKSSVFITQINNSKGGSNSENLINPDLTEKLRPLYKTFFSWSVNSFKEKLNITLSGLWLSRKLYSRKSWWDFPIFAFVYCNGVKQTYH